MANDVYRFEDLVPVPDWPYNTLFTDDGTGTDTIVVLGEYYNQTLPEQQFGCRTFLGGAWQNQLAAFVERVEYFPSGGFQYVSMHVLGLIENAMGGAGTDLLSGNDAANMLQGDPTEVAGSRDSLYGAVGNDTLYGMGGSDALYGGSEDDMLFGDDDPDYQQTNIAYGDDTLNGDEGNDTLAGGRGTNALNGGEGFDTANYGALYPYQSAGIHAVVNLAAGTASVFETDPYDGTQYVVAADTLTGIERVLGTVGSDSLTGGANGDVLEGGYGNDTAYGGGGGDTLTGGEGADALEGEGGDDALFGGDGTDQLFGGDGHDSLDGGAGSDGLYAGDGNDTLDAGPGGGVLAGGTGNDTYINPGAGGYIVESAGWGTDTVTSAASFSLEAIVDVERLFLTGTAAIDGTGNTAANHILGNDAANILNGRDGADTLNGGGGADTLNGGSGADTLTGGLQRDKIVTGADSAADIVRYSFIGESTGHTRDVIVGFDANGEDKFDLPVPPAAFAPAIGTGALNAATFNADLAARLTAAALPAGHAVLFNPSGGDLDQNGMVYLVADANGIAGYQANQDWVFQLENHTGTFDPTDFI